MIGFLSGVVRFADVEAACIDVGGVGYRVLMPLSDLARLPVGSGKVDVYVHTHVREDAIQLFGFSSREGLALFDRLIGVTGVGPRTALSLLSGMETGDLVRAVAEGNEARLCKVPGVGKKTAARIVLELRDVFGKELLTARMPGSRSDALDDLRSALSNLGYKAPQVEKAIKAVKPLADDGKGLDVLVREALKHVA